MIRVIIIERLITRWKLYSFAVLMLLCQTKSFGVSTPTGNKGFRVVAYMPAASGTANDIQYTKVTHINYASVRPTVEGGLTKLDNIQKLQEIVTKAHANGVSVGIAVGGWDDFRNDDFEAMAGKAEYRSAFIKNVVSLIAQYNLDGVDIDWEYPATAQDQINFASLLNELGNAIHANGKFLSAAVAANGKYADGVQNSVFTSVDFLNLLAYDGGNDDHHSPFDYAATSLAYWSNRGLAPSKAVLGIPFHARPTWKSYRTMIAEGANPNMDTRNGNYYNGIYTVVQKADLAFDRNIGGVMISNLSYDAEGSNSLVSAINSVVAKRSPAVSIQGPYNGLLHAIPGVIEAEHYDLGGEGLGYHDLTTGNAGGALRSDNVDVEVNTIMIDDHKVAGIEAGEWLNYSVDVKISGSLTLHASVASLSAGKTFHIEMNGIDISGKLTVPNTGGWQNWQTVTVTTGYIAKGKKVMRIVMDSGEFNINKVVFMPIDLAPVADAKTELDVEANGLVLHPNPGVSGVAQNITLTFETDQNNVAVSINDINGYKVFTQQYSDVTGNAVQVGLPNLSPGVYTVRIQGEGKTWAKKYLVK